MNLGPIVGRFESDTVGRFLWLGIEMFKSSWLNTARFNECFDVKSFQSYDPSESIGGKTVLINKPVERALGHTNTVSGVFA